MPRRQLHLLNDPVMQKIFVSKLEKLTPFIVATSALHLALLICVT